MATLVLYSEYTRQQVNDVFSPHTSFIPSSEPTGLHEVAEIPTLPGDFIFFVTFGQHQAGLFFDERITEAGVISWQSQPRQSLQDRRIQQLIHHDEKQNSVYLFLRTRRYAYYTYLGRLKYLAHDPAREYPVYIYWQLLDWPIPAKVLNRMSPTLAPAVSLSHILKGPVQHGKTILKDERMGFSWRGKYWNIDHDTWVHL